MKSTDGRRAWLRALAAVGAAGASGYIARALARGDLPSGVHRLQGTVTVGGKAAREGTPVALGDRIATGPGSQAVLVVHDDAFLMRSDTVIELKSRTGILSELLVTTGKVLSVFSKKPLNLRAGSATIGIRGTGAYLEVAPAEVYFCLCYGEAVVAGPGMSDKEVKTTHHEQPLLLTDAGGTMRADGAGFRNHADAELIMLESLVGREPPFLKDGVAYPAGKY